MKIHIIKGMIVECSNINFESIIMKVNLNRNLLDHKGQEAVELVDGKERKKSLRDMISEALYATGMNAQLGMDMAKKLRAYKMLQQIINNRGVLDIETDDATL